MKKNTASVQSPPSSTVRVLPETDEYTLCLEFTGLIRLADHKILTERLADMVKRQGWFNMFIYYNPDFRGWEQDAAADGLQSIVDFGKYARRLAYVNPRDEKRLRDKIAAPFLGGESRYFEESQFDEALAWAKSGDAA